LNKWLCKLKWILTYNYLRQRQCGENPIAVTILEIEEAVWAALAATPSADSAAKGKLRVADRLRSFKKKFELTFLP